MSEEHDHDEPSNAQEAFQFLIVGAGIVLIVRLIVAAFGLWSGDASGDALAQACAPFRNGYPLIGKHTVVVGGLPMIPRLAVAGLFVLTMGLLFALLAVPIGIVLKWGALRGAVIGGRIGLLLSTAWTIYALLCLPPHRVQVEAGGLTRHQAPSFLGVVPFPWTGSERHHAWSAIRTVEAGGPRSGESPGVIARTDEEVFSVARQLAMPDRASDGGPGTTDAERLAEALNDLRL